MTDAASMHEMHTTCIESNLMHIPHAVLPAGQPKAVPPEQHWPGANVTLYNEKQIEHDTHTHTEK